LLHPFPFGASGVFEDGVALAVSAGWRRDDVATCAADVDALASVFARVFQEGFDQHLVVGVGA